MSKPGPRRRKRSLTNPTASRAGAAAATGARIVIVSGDLSVSWQLFYTPRSGPAASFREDLELHLVPQAGGVALLEELLRALIERLGREGASLDVGVGNAAGSGSADLRASAHHYHQFYAEWAQFASEGTRERVWRIAELIGHGPQPDARWSAETEAFLQKELLPNAHIVVLNDEGQGFGDRWEAFTGAMNKNSLRPWVVLRTRDVKGSGKLWKYLVDRDAERLIVLIAADDLRRSEARVSLALSWERTAEDLCRELSVGAAEELFRARHVIVSMEAAGALLLSRRGDEPYRRLLLDPDSCEGAWKREGRGVIPNHAMLMVAAVCKEVMLNRAAELEPEKIERGMMVGLTAVRQLHAAGFQMQPESADGGPVLRFPHEDMAATLVRKPKGYSSVPVPSPDAGGDEWRILSARGAELDELAARIAQEGLRVALPDAPVAQFGKFQTVDRREIEGLNSVAWLLDEYLVQDHSAPLSIAVFGPPGSGKSFGVKQVAQARREQLEVKSFNLSQFNRPDELNGALHQVRDIGLSGRTPLVFWDEFDSPLAGEPLGWLRYFLAPMQDGEFQQGEITHPIGRCIFVFAGGTCPSVEDFQALKKFKGDRAAVKHPDFISRLKGSLNVLGPNPLNKKDALSIIRRATLLRSLLRQRAPQLFTDDLLHIDDQVLRAFLRVGRFKHGARSMESVIAMSQLTDKNHFERSALPPREQLDLHVDGAQFLRLVG